MMLKVGHLHARYSLTASVRVLSVLVIPSSSKWPKDLTGSVVPVSKREVVLMRQVKLYAGYVVAGDTDTYLTSQTYDMADSTVKSGDTTYYALRSAEQLAWFSYYVNHSKDNKGQRQADGRHRPQQRVRQHRATGYRLHRKIQDIWNAGWTGTFDGNHHAIQSSVYQQR